MSLLQALTGFEFDVVPLDPADTNPVHIKMPDVVGCASFRNLSRFRYEMDVLSVVMTDMAERVVLSVGHLPCRVCLLCTFTVLDDSDD